MFQNSVGKQIPKLSLRVKFEQTIMEERKEPSCFKIQKINKTAALVVA